MRRGTPIARFAFLCLLAALSSACTTRSSRQQTAELRLSAWEKIRTLDPVLVDDVHSNAEVGRTYEGLLQYHYLKRPYVLIPNLAESMPEVSADGRTYTFRLKKAVLFQDDPCFKGTGGKGRELTAEDVVFSLLRLADPKLAAPGWWLFDGKIVGLNEWRAAAEKKDVADYAAPVEGLRAVDRYTVQIVLKHPSPVFLYAFAMPATYLVPREAVAAYGEDFGSHPVGTGPFRLEDHRSAAKLVWVRNPTFRRELYPSEGEPGDEAAGLLKDAGKALPLVDRIVVSIAAEQQPLWLSFLEGKLDLSLIPKESYQQVVSPAKELTPEMKQKGLRLIKTPLLDVTHDSFNMSDPLVGKNKLLRQALSLAVNEEPYIDLFFNGRAIPAQGPIPPGLVGYRPDFRNPHRQFSIAKAKERLAAAGYPEGQGLPELEYITQSTSNARQMAEFLQGSFAAIGVKLKITAHSWNDFNAAVKNRRGQLWGPFSWNADYPDAENFLQLFYSKNVSPGPNDAGYVNAEFDRLFQTVPTVRSSAEREELYRKMVALVVEDCPWIPHVHRLAFDVTQPRLKNYKRHVLENSRVKYYRVEK